MDHFTLNRCDFVRLTFYSTKVNFTLNVDEVLPPKHFDLPLAALEMVRELCIRIRIRMEHGGICSNADQDVSETKTLPPRTRRRTPWLNGQQTTSTTCWTVLFPCKFPSSQRGPGNTAK